MKHHVAEYLIPPPIKLTWWQRLFSRPWNPRVTHRSEGVLVRYEVTDSPASATSGSFTIDRLGPGESVRIPLDDAQP